MPHSSSEQSLVTNCHPVLMGNSDILVKDEFGQSNPLEVSDYTSRNGELVNLENACVNIDNSSDVIIGPVTQFNVNGNVTIYQNENGQQRPADEGGTDTDTRESSYDANFQHRENSQAEEVDEVHVNGWQAMIKTFLWLSLAVFLIIAAVLILEYCFPNRRTENETSYATSQSPPSSIKLPNHQFFKKSDWGGRPPKWQLNITGPVNMVIIKHLRSRTCDSFPSCSKVVATQQSQDARDGHPDIYCSFLIGSDGNIYEGRGWGVQPQYRNDTVDIVYIGTYDIDKLTPNMIDAAKTLINDGVSRKYLTEDYIIVCHNQTSPNTWSPGQNIFKEVKTWPHYDSGIFFETTSGNTVASVKHSVNSEENRGRLLGFI
ncbi:uncharacterized protein isoform X3 [Leptinotarsa decemlineata]|uniref:uncharacterized protein isoform X3 n=1 Tax=Leptinotarsa decemlineata TaxID=7539 RepID=UPI003D30B6A1